MPGQGEARGTSYVCDLTEREELVALPPADVAQTAVAPVGQPEPLAAQLVHPVRANAPVSLSRLIIEVDIRSLEHDKAMIFPS